MLADIFTAPKKERSKVRSTFRKNVDWKGVQICLKPNIGPYLVLTPKQI